MIIPVGGPIYQGAGAAIKASGKGGACSMGVDADLYNTDPTVQGPAAHLDPEEHRRRRQRRRRGGGRAATFDNTPYVGT